MKRTMGAMALMIAGLFVTTCTAAQYYFYNNNYYATDWVIETGASAGAMNSLTDLGGRKGAGKRFLKDLNGKVTKPCFSLYVVAMYKDAIGIRLEFTSGHIGSADALLKNTDPNLSGRYGRNLSFRSYIHDLQLAAEIHPLFFQLYEEDQAPYWSPYLVTGISVFRFEPSALLNGHWYKLHSLRLEGQGFDEYASHKMYRLVQPAIPCGIGIKYEAGASLSIRLEIIHRILFTDYLDDVSRTYIDASMFDRYLGSEQAGIARQLYSRMEELQPGYKVPEGMRRGNEKDNDAFFSVQLKIGWVIRYRSK